MANIIIGAVYALIVLLYGGALCIIADELRFSAHSPDIETAVETKEQP